MSSKQDLTAVQKLTVSAIAGLVFLIISAPMTYKLVNGLTKAIGLNIADANGCPNAIGLVVHTIVFTLLIFGLMYVPMFKKK